MISLLIGMSLLFIAIGFIVTESNAKYLLAGYNTLPEEEKKKVDIKTYLAYFKRFHIFLGISFLVGGSLLMYFFDENIGVIFIGVYPILAYIYFIITSSQYSKGLSAKHNRIGVFVLVGSLLFVVGIIGYGFIENKLSFDSNAIEFHGSYGEVLSADDIESIELVNLLPKITSKTDGYAMGAINKGYFKTDDGEKIKLILNSDNKPYLLFTKVDGKKIYFSAKEGSNEVVFEEMKKELPKNLFEE